VCVTAVELGDADVPVAAMLLLLVVWFDATRKPATYCAALAAVGVVGVC